MRFSFSNSKYAQVFIVLLLAWTVRYAYVRLMPEEVRSADVYSWEVVAQTLWEGQNPYKETTVLNWPPVWMQLIYVMAKIAMTLQCRLMDVLRVFLVLVESLVIVAFFRFLRQTAPQAKPFVPILLGIAMNPVAILLTCQHCNLDVLIGLWVLLFVGQLIEYYRSRNAVDWLAACLFLGLGIVTKTVPLVLCPMLAGGFRRVDWRGKLVGLALLLGPVFLGMSVIYVLAPDEVIRNVLCYRSASGWFGISGLLHLMGADNLIALTNGLFYLLLAGAGGLAAFFFWKRDDWSAREIILCATLFLLAIPGIGPGYSPQYLYWFLPLLVASYFLYGRPWRWTVLVFGIVAALTCIVEYGIIPSHGMYIYFIIKHHQLQPSPALADILNFLKDQHGEILMRLPLFVAFLGLLTVGIQLLRQNLQMEAPVTEATPLHKPKKTRRGKP